MKKTLKDLTIRDSFMFAAVMADEKQCRRLIEMALGMKVLSLSIIAEKTLTYHPQYHGIRLDILAEDNEVHRRFNVEMQIRPVDSLPHRCRYYHAQLDMDALLAGHNYEELTDTYVIFICDFDPCGQNLYRYTFRNKCEETGLPLNDGSYTILLSTKGQNDADTPPELIHFLKYVGNPHNHDTEISEDDYVASLKKQIQSIQQSRDWEAKFMLLQQVLQDERKAAREEGHREGLREGHREGLREGHREGLREGRLAGSLDTCREIVLQLLATHGTVSDDLKHLIESETDYDKLTRWTIIASSAKSVDDFKRQIMNRQ